MAAKMSKTAPRRKEELLDVLQDYFIQSTKKYVSNVKEAMRAEEPETMAEIFQSAVAFLSQDLPDPTCQASDSQTKDYVSSLTEEMEALRERVYALEKQVQDDKQEMQKNCSSLELQVSASADSMTSKVLHLDKKLASLKSNVHALDSETRESLKDLSEVSKENSNAVKGLRKLQSLLKQTNQAAAAVTPPQTAATASASVSAISRPLKGVSHMKNFSARTTADQYTPQIVDVKLLAGGRLVLADDGNTCIKLFNTQGQHLCNLKYRDQPRRLAVIDSSGTSNSHTVAVTLPFCRGIDILEIEGDNIKVKKPLKTSRLYDAVAAVSKLTLAVGYRVMFHPPAIDLIDLEGQVLRKICSGVDPSYMDVTDDGNLICSSQDNTIARVQMNSGTVVFNKAVPMIIRPHGVAIAADKSLLITDTWDNVLHLVSPQGDRSKQLWLAPSGKDQGDDLCGLSMDGSVCVCVTGHGTVYVLDCMC